MLVLYVFLSSGFHHWLLHGHVTPEAVEFLCASVFIGDGHSQERVEGEEERPGIPTSKEVGFTCVIRFLKD
jgi:U3 small nucleolar RNA-associated protein 22